MTFEVVDFGAQLFHKLILWVLIRHLHNCKTVVQPQKTKSWPVQPELCQYSPPHFSFASPCLLLFALYELLSPSRAARAVFLVSPSDCCSACSATADRYPALCVWWARRHRWNNNGSACLYSAVSQLVRGTWGNSMQNNHLQQHGPAVSTGLVQLIHVIEQIFDSCL